MKKSIILVSVILMFYSCNNQQADKPEEQTKNRPVFASEVSYEFMLETQYQPWLQGLDKKKLVDLILDKVIAGELQAYDYMDGKKVLSKQEILFNCGIETDSTTEADTTQNIHNLIPRDRIKSIIFTEEWYLDETTLKMEKKVLGMAPVLYLEKLDETGEIKLDKKIIFSVFMEDFRKALL